MSNDDDDAARYDVARYAAECRAEDKRYNERTRFYDEIMEITPAQWRGILEIRAGVMPGIYPVNNPDSPFARKMRELAQDERDIVMGNATRGELVFKNGSVVIPLPPALTEINANDSRLVCPGCSTLGHEKQQAEVLRRQRLVAREKPKSLAKCCAHRGALWSFR